jgi:hypothetical protein
MTKIDAPSVCRGFRQSKAMPFKQAAWVIY